MLEQYHIRKAQLDELEQLETLMMRSLSLWNYSEEELAALKIRLKISPEMLSKSIVYVAELDNKIKGFWCVGPIEELSEARFYIEPSLVKKGIGTLLWDKALIDLKTKNIKYITFISDANAQGFYEKKNAVKIGQQPSVVFEGEDVPIMRYYLK